jgi:hypothetical protein
MTPLNYLTIVTSLLALVINVHIVLHPESLVGWKRRSARAFAGSTAVLCILVITLALTSHGKA